MDDKDTITITGSSSSNDTILIDLSDTYGSTTSYIDEFNISTITIPDTTTPYTVSIDNSSFNYSSIGNVTITNTTGDWWNIDPKTHLEIEEVEKMCAEYPALAKVYENFKTVYDLVKQDWEGKKNADENS